MLDASNIPKPHVNKEPRTINSSWDQLFDYIFSPLHEWPKGSLFSNENIRIKATELILMFEQLSKIELGYNEVVDINKFIRDFESYLAVLEAGPSKNLSYPTNLLSGILPYRHPHKISQLTAEFITYTRNALEELHNSCMTISKESRLAEELQLTSNGPIESHLRYRQTINLNEHTSLGKAITRLSTLTQTTLNENTPTSSRDSYQIERNQLGRAS